MREAGVLKQKNGTGWLPVPVKTLRLRSLRGYLVPAGVLEAGALCAF